MCVCGMEEEKLGNIYASLVPRPTNDPVIAHLQYAFIFASNQLDGGKARK